MGTSDRFPYKTATVLDQDLLDECQDNLTTDLQMVAEIETPTDTIFASDRNKYVGSVFYEALVTFPVIRRTVGEWLSTELEFSTIDLELSNVDGRYNSLLPGGADFGGWLGKEVLVKLGLRDVASTYTTIFSGKITNVAGIGRTVQSIKITARDKFDELNVAFPNTVLTRTAYPDITDQNAGLVAPVIYGDWTTGVTEGAASVPAFVVNGAETDVVGGTRDNVILRISDNDNRTFDTTEVYLSRGSEYFLFDSADIVSVAAGKNQFEIDQDTGNTMVDGAHYLYSTGDAFFVKVEGKDLGAYDDNIVEICRDILITYGGLTAPDFDSSWDTYRDKAAPPESSISTIVARFWRQEPETAMAVVLSLLEQVRLEAFINRDLKVAINSLHFDDFVAAPGFTVRNWDLAKNTLQPQVDTQNNFNRAKGEFSFLPDANQQDRETSFYRNQDAIDQAGLEISKRLVFPNLYAESDVELQLIEILKLASAYLEVIDAELTWRSILKDIGDFMELEISIGSTIFSGVPTMIREIGYDPSGLRVPVKLFSFQMVPFPGFVPDYPLTTTGGSTATITEET